MIKFCSGFGQKDSPKYSNNPESFLRLTYQDIKSMAEDPQDIPKNRAQWCIPSILPSRVYEDQRKHGDRHFLTFDKDQNPEIDFDELINRAAGVIPGELIAYTSKGASEDNQKARIIIPLDKPVSGEMGVVLQIILNNRMESVGVIPDRAMERPNQICYLPNRGAFYKSLVNDFAKPFDPLVEWAEDIAKIQEQIEAKKATRAQEKAEAIQKGAQMVQAGTHNVLQAFNHAWGVSFTLSHYGYKRVGKKYLSPLSESGNPGVSISDDGQKWFSHHSSDGGIGRRNGDGTFGDAWDLFKYFEHDNDQKAALHAAGNMFQTDDGVTLEKANQREYMEQQTTVTSENFNFGDDQNPLSGFTLNGESAEMEKRMLEDQYILGSLAILGQGTIFYSKPNAGKTLLTVWMVTQSINDKTLDGGDVFYINADDTHKGLTEKLKIAEDHGFNMMAPGYKGFKSEMLAAAILKMIETKTARGKVLVLDTVKKFTDLMSKEKTSKFAETIRQFISHGGSVIMLAHVNKHRGDDGKVIYAGTADLVDDADCAYTLDIVTDDPFSGERVVKFENFKNRGDVALEASYKYDAAPFTSYANRMNSIEALDNNAIKSAERYRDRERIYQKNKNIVPEIKEVLKENGPMNQKSLIKMVMDNSGIGKKIILKVLKEHSGKNLTSFYFWDFVNSGEKNEKIYSLKGEK